MNIKMKTGLKPLFLMVALFLSPESNAMTAVQRAAGRSCAAISRSVPRIAAARTQWASAQGQQGVSARAFSSLPTARALPAAKNQPRRSFSGKSLPSSSAGAALLVETMQSGSKEKLHDLIKKGLVDINARYKNNDTILHIAAGAGVAPDIIWLLIDAGATVDAKNDDNRTPLHVAAAHRNLGGVQALVAKKADPNAVDKPDSALKKTTPLSFLSSWFAQGNESEFPGRSPLYLAQEHDISTKDTLAVIQFLEPLTEKSLWFVVTPEIRLRRAIKNDNLPLLKNLLLEQKFSQEILNKSLFYIYYWQKNTADLLSMLLDAGADVHAQRSWSKDTALHEAASDGNVAAVRLLLVKQANPNTVNGKGKTALDLAREDFSPSKSKLEVIRILEAVTEKGIAKPGGNLSLEEEISLLRRAINSNKLSIVQQVLSQHSFRLEALNAGLISAAEGSSSVRSDMLALLLDAGAEINTVDTLRQGTALYHAVRYENSLAVQLLLSRGANPNIPDEYKRSALYIAQEDDTPSQETIKIIRILKPLTDPSLWFVVTPEVMFARAVKHGNKEEVRSALDADEQAFKTQQAAEADEDYQQADFKSQQSQRENTKEQQQKARSSSSSQRSARQEAKQDAKKAGTSTGRGQHVGKKLVGNQQELLDAARSVSSKKSVDDILHSIVGVDTAASEGDAYKAWLQWVKLHHPDRYQDEQLNQKATVVMQYLSQHLKDK